MGLTRKGQATRERIVSAASRLMLEQGVARTTIEDIQNAAQVSPSQLYHYFPGKHALVLAVIDHQTGQVMDVQHQGLDQLDSFPALKSWRDLMVGILTKVQCAGGCPLGLLASDLAEADPVARVQLANAFAMWEGLLREGLEQMQERGELSKTADAEELALAMLAAVQGGLLLSQVRRDPKPLVTAVDTMIAHLRTLAA
ncbi:TetR family transcriptional regulator [Kribbella orskensis]|uniref:TetR family transcriptional regulator n=1 Tax=Kribbella orskensis TaxID=2512216 RepID=A0ABY2BTR7_9ACTN|nr:MULTISPECIES: TetR/AcrR family transcriptional regulator [Kribbella]TCN44587.1 TetR family transcriptional regulator [Kribbella sp. VKM Ac-2500]TCO31635.1 TetR family transcriptional regulator [Kribbella orskensis]